MNENKILREIIEHAKQKLQAEYGYVGAAESPEMTMLNSGGEGENIVITIKHQKD